MCDLFLLLLFCLPDVVLDGQSLHLVQDRHYFMDAVSHAKGVAVVGRAWTVAGFEQALL
jgi:hypothetical protein